MIGSSYVLRLIICMMCLFQVEIGAQIYTVYTLDMLSDQLPYLDDQTLVIFDRDDTLFQGIDCVDPAWRKQLVAQWLAIYDEQKTVDAAYRTNLSQQIATHQPRLIDMHAPALIKRLQEKGVKIIMCTGGCYGKNTVGESVEDISIDMLTHAGIDLSGTFADCSGMILRTVHCNGHSPMFTRGALLCNTCDKGQALLALLDAAHWLPRRIIFVDDKMRYQQEIQRAAEGLGIPFTGLHYRGAERLQTPDLAAQCYSMSYLLARDLV